MKIKDLITGLQSLNQESEFIFMIPGHTEAYELEEINDEDEPIIIFIHE